MAKGIRFTDEGTSPTIRFLDEGPTVEPTGETPGFTPGGLTDEEFRKRAIDEAPGALAQIAEVLRGSTPTVGAIAGGVIGGLATGGTPFGAGTGSVLGSTIARGLFAPEQFENLPQVAREEMMNMATPFAPIAGRFVRPKAWKGGLGLMTHAAGTGGAVAGMGQAANAVTGQPISALQALVEGGMAGTFEGVLAKPFEVAARPVNKASPAYGAAKNLGVEKEIPKAFFAEPDSPVANLMRIFTGTGETSSMRAAADKAYDALSKAFRKIPMPGSDEAGTILRSVSEHADALAAKEVADRAGRIQGVVDGLIPPASRTAPESGNLLLAASDMNEAQSIKLARELVHSIEPGMAIDAAGEGMSRTLNIVNNARKGIGERMGQMLTAMSNMLGNQPINTDKMGMALLEAQKKLVDAGVPGNSQTMNIVSRMVKELLPEGEEAVAKTFTVPQLADKLKALRAAIESVNRTDKVSARLLQTVKDAGEEAMEDAVRQSNHPDTKAVLGAWGSTKGKYRDFRKIQDAMEASSTGTGLSPAKFKTEMDLLLPQMTALGAPPTQKLTAFFSANPQAGFASKISGTSAQDDFYRLLKSSDEGAWTYAKQNPDVERWALARFADDAVRVNVTPVGEIAGSAGSRGELGKQMIANPGFGKSLSQANQDILNKLQADPNYIPTASELALTNLANAGDKADAAKIFATEALNSPAIPVETLERMGPTVQSNVPGQSYGDIAALAHIAPTGEVNLNLLNEFTKNLREGTDRFMVNSPSTRRMMATMSPEAVNTLRDLGTLGTTIADNISAWPKEAVERFLQVIRSALSAQTAGSTAAGQVAAITGAGKTATGAGAASIMILLPRMLRHVANTNYSPEAMRAIAAAISATRMIGSKAGQALGGIFNPRQEVRR